MDWGQIWEEYRDLRMEIYLDLKAKKLYKTKYDRFTYLQNLLLGVTREQLNELTESQASIGDYAYLARTGAEGFSFIVNDE